MKKIVFIEPVAAGEHIFSHFNLPRTGIFILGAMMRDRGWEVDILVESPAAIEGYDFGDVSLAGISTITPTAGAAYRIADFIRSRGVTVIMGGPHVTFLPEEALDHADFVIRGEGETPLMSFIDAFESGSDFSAVPNLSMRTSDGFVHKPSLPFESDLDRLPFADFSLLRSGNGTRESMKVIPVQTSRGCPHECSFCSVTGMFGRKYRFRSTGHVLAELRRYRDANRMIFFCDDNFCANPERTKELLRAMLREGLVFKWSTQARADVVRDPELLALMKRAGCHTLFIGFESIDPQSLIEMHKRQTVSDIVRAIGIIHGMGINIHGMFVIGFRNDSWFSVRETVRFAKKLRLASTQYLVLTPLPGSRISREMEDRIVTRDWSLYDTHHVVFRPHNFTMHGLQRAQIYSHRSFYSLLEMARKIAGRRWVAAGINIYARLIFRRWVRENRGYLAGLRKRERTVNVGEGRAGVFPVSEPCRETLSQ